MQTPSAICRVCGNSAPADQFRLHYKHRQVVCPNCFKGKIQKKEPPKEEKVRPPGWDAEDEYLEKISKYQKDDDQGIFKKVPGMSQVMCTCKQCKFEFRYDPFRKRPKACPYCDNAIPRYKGMI